MKNIKNKLGTWIKSFKKTCKKIKEEHLIRAYVKENVLFLTFVITCVLNSTILRFFCIHSLENYLAIAPILADLSIVIIVGGLGYLLKPKNRFGYFLGFNIFFTAICMINSIYYSYYTSFASVSMLSLTQYIGDVGDAVVEQVVHLRDLVFLLSPIIMIFVNYKLKKKNYYKKVEIKSERKKKTIKTVAAGAIVGVVFLLTLTPTDMSRLVKQWNREYIVMKYGIYIYQANDVVASIQPKINSLFGYDQAKKNFTDYFKDSTTHEDNKYTNIFEGKNVIVIHGESLQTNLMDLSFNGEEVTPNLNKLANEGMFFSNFYSPVSVGTSSDAELMFNTSLMPTKSGTAFVSYSNRTYNAIPKLLGDKGYYTFSMHGNNADFWNRRTMHQSLGYDRFYSKEDYDVTEENTVGLGINDYAFFDQSVDKIKKIAEKNSNWYGLLIMLSNHTPFSEVDKYGEFPVDIKETVTNPDGTTEEVTYPYMEGTKLGNYFKSAHYADGAIGELMTRLDEEGLLENTVVVIYGDHDARLPRSEYNLLYNYDKETDSVLDEEDPNYKEYDSYQYELGRKVPLIIWTKDMKGSSLNKEYTNVMSMYDVEPTLGNMFGFTNEYALGHDIFDIKDQNIVVFPNGNWLTNKVYYNSQKEEYYNLTDEAVSEEEIRNNNEYATKLLDVSNEIITFDLLKEDQTNENELRENQEKGN